MMEQPKISQYVPREMSYIFSSDPANGAQNVSENGSRFSVQLNRPIRVPRTAKAVTLEVTDAAIWWTIPNISSDLDNDQFRFIENTNNHTIVISKGLYSLSDFNRLISRELVNLGLASDLISFVADNASQKTVAVFGAANVQIDFSGANTPRLILGWDSRLVPLVPSTANQSETGDNVAAFNTVNSFLLHSSLVSEGIPVNNEGANIISSVPIDVAPGSQIVYQPNNPTRAGVSELIGRAQGNFQIWLTDQNSNAVDTNGEVFSLTVIIRYWDLL